MFPANITDFPETWVNLGEISILFNGWFRWEECENGGMLDLCKEISSAMCSPAPMVENAKGVLKNALMCWGIGGEGGGNIVTCNMRSKSK